MKINANKCKIDKDNITMLADYHPRDDICSGRFFFEKEIFGTLGIDILSTIHLKLQY